MFVCKNCDKQYINEKCYVKHEINCEKRLKDKSLITIEHLLERIHILEKEVKSLKNKMAVEEWLTEYYSENVEDYNTLEIDISNHNLKHILFNTVTKGIEKILENHNLECMKFINHKMYYYIDSKWAIMPEKELQQFIQRMIKAINQAFDEYVENEKILDMEDNKYAEYTSKLYSTNFPLIIKKAIHSTCKIEYP